MKRVSHCILVLLGVVAGCAASSKSDSGGNTASGQAEAGYGGTSSGSSGDFGQDSGEVSAESGTFVMEEGGSEDAGPESGSGFVSDAEGADSGSEDASAPEDSAASQDSASCASSCTGCCDSAGNCNVDGTQSAACGAGGASCQDCTTLGETCTAGACVGVSAEDAGANSCSTKVCFDGFDCLFQGCANGCGGTTPLHCN